MKVLLTLITFFLIASPVMALDVDEKLTLRLLRVSSSKKTILINRGLEDGLVVGDHAKFFLTTGVIFRAVVAKASPTRSIWSVYRLVNPGAISVGRVLNLKISTPVKLSDDPTRASVAPLVSAGVDSINIPLDEGADDLPPKLSEDDQQELGSLGGKTVAAPADNTLVTEDLDMAATKKKTLEVFSTVQVSQLTGTYQQGENAEVDSEEKSMDFAAGFEKYFDSPSSFWSKISISGLLHKRDTSSGSGTITENAWMEFGGGLSYHFWNPVWATSKPIGFVNTSFGLGSMTSTTTTTNTVTNETTSVELSGSSNFFALGGGIKYYSRGGWGGRIILDYYRTAAELTSDSIPDETVSLSLAGIRVQAGISYRF